MTVKDDLQSMPLRRRQCSDGCYYLRKTPDSNYYYCSFWKEFKLPLVSPWVPVSFSITTKQIEGPHTDEPTLTCPQFVKLPH